MIIITIWAVSVVFAMFAYGLTGFLLGLFLGPLGTILALMFRSQKQRRKQHAELLAVLKSQSMTRGHGIR